MLPLASTLVLPLIIQTIQSLKELNWLLYTLEDTLLSITKYKILHFQTHIIKVTLPAWPGNPNLPTWTRINTNIEAECHCDVTYVKIRVFGRFGTELRANANNSITCDSTCGNPWPAPAPVGYTCGTITSNDKNITTCNNMKQLQTAARQLNIVYSTND